MPTDESFQYLMCSVQNRINVLIQLCFLFQIFIVFSPTSRHLIVCNGFQVLFFFIIFMEQCNVCD